jgi:hypothetical protein
MWYYEPKRRRPQPCWRRQRFDSNVRGFHEVPATNDQRWGLCQTLWAVRAKPSKKYWDTWRKPKPNLQSESSVFEHVFFLAQMCPGEFMYVWSDGQMDLSENCGYPKLWHNVNQNILIDYAK